MKPISSESKERGPDFNWERLEEVDAIEAGIENASTADFFPYGKFLAEAEEKAIRILKSESGKEVFKFETQTGAEAMAVRKDGMLAVGDFHGNLKMYDGNNGKEYRSFGLATKISAITFAPDGKVVYAGEDQAIRVYDPGLRSTEPMLSTVFKVSALAVSPEKGVAYGGKDGRLEICDAKTWRCSYHLDFKSKVSSLSFAPGGKLLVGLENGNIKVLDSKTGDELKTLEGHIGEVLSVRWTEDNRVKSSAKDGTIRTWGVKG